jgi:hypothetical protein
MKALAYTGDKPVDENDEQVYKLTMKFLREHA